MSGRMGALNTAGSVTFLPEDSPFSEYTEISGRAHAWARGRDSQAQNPRQHCQITELATLEHIVPGRMPRTNHPATQTFLDPHRIPLLFAYPELSPQVLFKTAHLSTSQRPQLGDTLPGLHPWNLSGRMYPLPPPKLFPGWITPVRSSSSGHTS